MRTSEEAYELIRRCEGFRAQAYRCPAGVWTIGYGHTQGVNSRTPPITREQADLLLRDDVEAVEQRVRELLQRSITVQQFSALVCFAFNVGVGNLRKSRLLRLVNEGDVLAASAEFGRWVYAGGQKQAGLVKRREAERVMFLKPVVV